MARSAEMLGAVLLAAALPAAGAERLALVGVPLGQPLAWPECPTRALYRGHLVYDEATATCWRYPLVPQKGGDGRPPADGQVEVRALPVPAIIGAGSVAVTLDRGVVAQVSVKLPRRGDQDAALALLQAQFGPATALERAEAIDTRGARLSTLMASWALPDGLVELTGATTPDGDGIVTATTRAHAERLRAPIDPGDDGA